MVDHMLLTHYGPSGIVVDKELRIIEFRGNMNPYLQIRQGEVKSRLLAAVRTIWPFICALLFQKRISRTQPSGWTKFRCAVTERSISSGSP